MICGVVICLMGLTGCLGEPDTVVAEGFAYLEPGESELVTVKKSNLLVISRTTASTLTVKSIFSTLTRAPEIAYVGRVTDVEQVKTKEYNNFAETAPVVDNGGYLIRIGVSGSMMYVKLMVTEASDGYSIYIHYKVYNYKIFA